MNKNIFEISDSEKGRILELHKFATDNHYLIYEQNPPQATPIPIYSEVKTETSSTFPPQNLNNLFAIGAYNSEKLGPYVESLKPSIDKFIKESGYSKFKLNITAGESRITNPEEFKTPGSLALKRAQTLANYFKKTFKDYIEKGILVITEPQSIQDVSIGTTEYIKGSSSPESISHKTYLQRLPNYKKEQFVNFELTGEGKSVQTSYVCNYQESAKGEVASPDKNFIFLERNLDVSKLPDGQIIEFKFHTYMVPDLLLITAGGKQYSSGWVHYREAGTSALGIAFATALYYTYGNNVPDPFPKDITPITYDVTKHWASDNDGHDITKWTQSYLGHIIKDVDFTNKKALKNIKWHNFKKYPFVSRYTERRKAIKDSQTGQVTYDGNVPVRGGFGGTDLYITKDSSMSSVNIKIYSPIGTTIFDLQSSCL